MHAVRWVHARRTAAGLKGRCLILTHSTADRALIQTKPALPAFTQKAHANSVSN